MNYVSKEDYFEEKVIVTVDDTNSSESGVLYKYNIIIINSITEKEVYSLVMSKYVSKEVQ